MARISRSRNIGLRCVWVAEGRKVLVRYIGFENGFCRAIFGMMLVVSFLTGYVLWHSGYYEPFYGFQAGQAVVQVGCTSVGIIISGLVIAWTATGIAKGKMRRGWASMVVLAMIDLVLMGMCLIGYLADLRK